MIEVNTAGQKCQTVKVTAPHLKSLRHLVRPILLPVCVYEGHVLDFIQQSVKGEAETPELTFGHLVFHTQEQRAVIFIRAFPVCPGLSHPVYTYVVS